MHETVADLAHNAHACVTLTVDHFIEEILKIN